MASRHAGTLCTAALLSSVLILFSPARAPGQEQPATTPKDTAIPVVLAPRCQAVLTAEVSARLLTICKELGQPFAKGDALLVLDSAQYQQNHAKALAQHALAKAQLASAEQLFEEKVEIRKAEAALKLAQNELAAAETLFRQKSVSALELEKARTQVAMAEADLALAQSTALPRLETARRDMAYAQSNLEQAKRELGACTICAPFDGRVVRVLAHEHEWMQQGQVLIEVVDDGVLLAQFLLPSRLYRQVRLQAAIPVRLREVQEKTTARISHISATMDPASETFEVHATVDNRDHRLQSGMTGEVDLIELRSP